MEETKEAVFAEMLEALEATMEYWDSCGFSDCEEGCDCIVQSVEQAIEKAHALCD